MRRVLVFAFLLSAPPAGAVTIDWVEIGDPGNAADPDTDTDNCGPSRDQPCGSVASSYRIGRYEVTNAQYAEFLNEKAVSDPLSLYSSDMGLDPTFGGITRSGSDGSYSYAAKSGFESKPVVYVTFYDAIRFSNWLNNGQGAASTETGAYTLLGGTVFPTNGLIVTRNPNATVFLPSESEWYKAAYYDPISNGYFDFPAGTNTQTVCSGPTAAPNHANCVDYPAGPNALTNAGAYTGSESPNGTFDQGGNAMEQTEEIFTQFRIARGGSFRVWPAAEWTYVPTQADYYTNGFRVASIPEPGTGMLVMTGLLGLAGVRRRRG